MSKVYSKNKKKIINDPVYGFISVPGELLFDLIEHPYFQRLRYIKQLSMTHLVYPGALHTRFHHALGAMHLMSLAVDTLGNKGVEISDEEKEAVLAAILLHDIGHGPFSHSLEKTIIEDVSHEDISLIIMNRLNEEFEGKLTLAIQIFQNQYSKKFLHELVSSQLDTDRMDYLNRDSFFTGVSEGVISFDRIIKMLNVKDNQLVVEEKGVYSVEKFLIARRLMYWQVYLHKTVIASEGMLINVLKRVKYLYNIGYNWPVSQSLEHFLRNKITRENFENNPEHLDHFTKMDDVDILSAIKVWSQDNDPILSLLCKGLLNRNLFHTDLQSDKPNGNEWFALISKAEVFLKKNQLSQDDLPFILWGNWIENSAYQREKDEIKILRKDGSVIGIEDASDLFDLDALSKQVRKFAVTYPKNLNID